MNYKQVLRVYYSIQYKVFKMNHMTIRPKLEQFVSEKTGTRVTSSMNSQPKQPFTP